MRNARHLLLLMATLSAVAIAGAVEAGGAIETDEFATVTDTVHSAVLKYGAEKVLLVCDIDNTLLAVQGDLGSDQWFEWQSYLLNNEPDSPHLVADSFEKLLAAQGLLFTLSKMRPPESDIPDQITALQATGVRTLVLTSRGDVYRPQTERELRANGYDFASTSIEMTDRPCGVYMPYDLTNVELSGLTADEAIAFGLQEPRGVSYSEGVFMSSGQHKGAMLLTVLARCPQSFQAVVFVDDHGRHVVRVYDALARRGIDVTAIHYQREDEAVKRFRYSDKQSVSEAWRQLDQTLETVFP